MNLFSIYDKRSKNYFRVIQEHGVEQAKRGFEHVVNSGDSILRQYPDDFELHSVGDIDMTTGFITQDAARDMRPILTAREVMKDLPVQSVLDFNGAMRAAMKSKEVKDAKRSLRSVLKKARKNKRK